MGLFTNRKSTGSDIDFVSSRDAIDALGQRNEIIDDDTDVLYELQVPDAIPDEAAPFADDLDDDGAALAEVGITLEETEPELPPGPNRRSPNQNPDEAIDQVPVDEMSVDSLRVDHVHDDTIDIDVDGLLDLLGVAPDASLGEISEARLRFLDAHDPQAETRADAAEIKERIRRQINTAYATFRLTRAG